MAIPRAVAKDNMMICKAYLAQQLYYWDHFPDEDFMILSVRGFFGVVLVGNA